MSHFTYEIDEKNLREKLHSIKVPHNEDAWRRFDSYSESQPKASAPRGFKNINIALDRKVIMPVAFGVIVISFSLLLFNFVSISDRKPLRTSKAEAKTIRTEVKQPVAHEHVSAGPAFPASTVNQPVMDPDKIQPAAQISNQVITPGAQTTAPVLQKKKRQPKPVEIIETEALPDIRPTLIPATEEPELRPN